MEIAGWPGAAKKDQLLKRPAASVAFGETYGGNIPDPKNKNEKKPRTAASLDSDGNPDLTMKYRFAPMQKKGSSAILRYDENGKKQVCQVSGFNNLLYNCFLFYLIV